MPDDVSKAPSTPEELEREIIALYGFVGSNPAVIARKLGCDEKLARRVITKYRNESKKNNLVEFDELRRREMIKLEWTENEAREAWERSKEVIRKSTKKMKTGGGKDSESVAGELEITKSEEEQLGDPRFLQILNECRRQRADALGTDAPKRIHITEEHERQLVMRTLPVFQKYLLRLGATEDDLKAVGAELRAVLSGTQNEQKALTD